MDLFNKKALQTLKETNAVLESDLKAVQSQLKSTIVAKDSIARVLEDVEAERDALKAIAEGNPKKKLNTAVKKQIEELETQVKDLKKSASAALDKVASLETKLEKVTKERDEAVASQKEGGKKISDKKIVTELKKKSLSELKKALEKVPSGSRLGGTAVTYNKKSKKVVPVELTSKEQALDLIKQAEKGTISIVF